jgi:hypothetical protein
VPKSAKKKSRRPKRNEHQFGSQFDERRTKEGRGDPSVVRENLVSVSCAAGSSHFDHLLALGRSAKPPLTIKYLNPNLKEPQFTRGRGYFGYLPQMIEQIMLNHPELRWWLTSEGLVVDEVPPDLDSLSPFDRLVGPLSIQLPPNGRLSLDTVILIAQELDAKGFKLQAHLQPEEWKNIVSHNQKHTGKPLQSFSLAANNPRYVKFVRRSIYRARDRYKKALHLES